MNPEGYTGYGGAPARRIWNAMYGENCFKSFRQEELCLEERFFYRLISGMQASVSAHIAANYPLEDGSLGYNLAFYQKTVGDYPDRVNNIYFTYVVLLRYFNQGLFYLT
jgi:ERO1-like protein alpha